MPKLLSPIFILQIFSVTFFLFMPFWASEKVLAQNVNIRCNEGFQKYVQSVTLPPEVNLADIFNVKVVFTSIADTSLTYYLKATRTGTPLFGQNLRNIDYRSNEQQIRDPKKPEIDFQFGADNVILPGSFQLSLIYSPGWARGEIEVCKLGNINFVERNMNLSACNLKMPDKVEQGKSFTMNLDKIDQPNIEYAYYFFQAGDVNINQLPKGMAVVETAPNLAPISKFTPGKNTVYSSGAQPQNPAGANGISIPYSNSGDSRLKGGDYVTVVEVRRWLGTQKSLTLTGSDNVWLVSYCSYHPFTVSSDPTSAETDGTAIAKPGTGGTLGGEDLKTETCLEKLRKDPNAKCAEAGGKRIEGCNDPTKPGYDPKNPAITTAIGCIHTNPVEFTKDLMKFVIGISGGLAFLMMLMGAFQILSSGDNPDTLKAGRERLTSAVIGLLIVIFAILLLQIIGVGILAIPGFRP